MASDEGFEETTVSDRGMTTIPAALRERLDIEPGDKIRWKIDDTGSLSIEVIHQQYGAFEGDDLKAALGGDGSETHDLAGHEGDQVFTEDS